MKLKRLKPLFSSSTRVPFPRKVEIVKEILSQLPDSVLIHQNSTKYAEAIVKELSKNPSVTVITNYLYELGKNNGKPSPRGGFGN